MTRTFPSISRVESFKKEAKQWLKALRAGDAEALARLKAALPEHDGSVTLRAVQLALAREHRLPGWRELLASTGRERELREVADEMLRHAIFHGDPAVAARLFERHPDVAKVDLFTAVAAGDVAEVERRLAADPAAANRPGGPRHWPPLLYLAYLRLPGGARGAVDVARALLDRGADPNAQWLDDWSNPFKVLTGVIGLGERVQPPHERAVELADLLLERGADPYDFQAFYNTSIVGDDTFWLHKLWEHSERRGVTEKWRAVLPNSKNRMTPLNLMLSLAVNYGHARRAEWLLAHGADAGSNNAYGGRPQLEQARMAGHEAIAELLKRYGAPDVPLDDRGRFHVAVRNNDLDEIRRLVARHPEALRHAAPLHLAASAGRRDVVELLLDLGMQVDVEDHDGHRALGRAVESGALDVVKLLIERGADVDRPTKHYDGPVGAASFFKQRAVAELLAPLSRDVHNLVALGMKERLRELFAAEPELANLPHHRSGVTPLFKLPQDEPAALDMGRFLLEHGADASRRNADGDTPADVARKCGFTALAELLSRR